MSPRKTHMLLLAVPFVFGLGAAGYAAGMTASEQTVEAPACALNTATINGSLALEAQFIAGETTDGLYELTIRSVGGANHTNLRQGGGFAAKPAEPVTLGRTTLGGNAAYDVTLTVKADGKTYECKERFGASA